MFIALFLVVSVLFSPVSNAAVHEINIGGLGYVYGSEYASEILKDSPYRTPGAIQHYVNTEAEYPNTSKDSSTLQGALSTLALIRNICSEDPDCKVDIFAGSNGSSASSLVNDMMIASNDPLLKILGMYLTVNPRDPYGGIGTSFPTGSTIPLTEITAGAPTQSGGAFVMSFRNMYDPISDFPDHPFNLLADFNAFLAFYTEHPQVNPDLTDPRNVVTASADGTFISVLVYAKMLPILKPFAFLPEPALYLLDKILRPIIDSAYTRPGPSAPIIQSQTEESAQIEAPAVAAAPQQRTATIERQDQEPIAQAVAPKVVQREVTEEEHEPIVQSDVPSTDDVKVSDDTDSDQDDKDLSGDDVTAGSDSDQADKDAPKDDTGVKKDEDDKQSPSSDDSPAKRDQDASDSNTGSASSGSSSDSKSSDSSDDAK